MAYLRLILWLTLLFYDLQHFGPKSTCGQQITLQTLENFHSLKELQIDESYRLERTNKIIVKRDTDSLTSPQIFKFELDDAKEPDEETKKLIQTRARELMLKEQDVEVVNMTVSKRSKRATQKIIPELIPFLITDAREPDNATKELIRKSRAKELSLLGSKESTRPNRHIENTELIPKAESVRKSRGKPFSSINSNKESLKQGRIRSVPMKTETKEPIRQERYQSVTLTTESKTPLRKGKVQSVPLTDSNEEYLRVNRATKISSQKKKQPSKNRPRKRTRRYAQLTEPRYIKFELQDVKKSDSENSAQILPKPVFGSKLLKQASASDSDSSAQESKYRFYIQQAPRKAQYGHYPKRYEHKGMVFRVGKMQKYIASGQGLENINTNIQITIPPAVTAIVPGYPKPQVYGQKICPYGYQGCQGETAAPSVAPVASIIPLAPPAAPQPQEGYKKPDQNSVSENEVLPEQNQQRFYYNVYTPPQPVVHQQFIPIAKPHEPVAEIIQVPVIQQQPVQEPQVAKNLIDDGKSSPQTSLINIAYLDPSQGYDNKIYSYPIVHQPQSQPEPQAVVLLDGAKNQEDLQSQSNDQANQLALLQNNQEFQELSALVGKSPMDQVHGLTYLLAKEMQRKKKSQRPQDQTSPIVFHPKETTSNTESVQPLPDQDQNSNQDQNYEKPKVEENRAAPYRPLRQLYPHTNLPQVQPIHPVQPIQSVQPIHQDLQHQERDAKDLGLSPNYNGIDNHNYLTQKIYPQIDKDSTLEYASKYSFGYRVRDLHSGNDFSHKQNRDQDGVTRGQYQILMPDGRMQNVVYYADDTGFHADIIY